ncbi:hypothetical protein TNCV_1519791 [Trichonephila clavipes]|nr:hypothetical protein TNCV_1519791 [Trichonephila clavipes]
MRKDGMRNEGHEIPGCIADPISEPRIEGLISNPECFGEPVCTAIYAHFPGKRPGLSKYNQNIFDNFKKVFFHSQCLTVLFIRNNGFTLTNKVVSYAMDQKCPNELFKFLHYLNVVTICVTDQHSKQKFMEIQANWSSLSQFKRTSVTLLNSNGRDLGQCPFCN